MTFADPCASPRPPKPPRRLPRYNKYMRRLFWFTLLAFAARAQSVLNGPAAEEARSAFTAPEPSVLRCQFSKTPPMLDYRFRFQVAFTVTMPRDELGGNIRRWTLLLRVTPDGRGPVFFSIANAKPESGGFFKAGFAVGDGSYAIAAILRNESGGSCFSEWRVDAHDRGPGRAFDSPLAPAAVVATDSVQPPSPALPHSGPRITILLDAASFVPGRAKLADEDVRALSESLESLVERLPSRRLRSAASASTAASPSSKMPALPAISPARSGSQGCRTRGRRLPIATHLARPDRRQPKSDPPRVGAPRSPSRHRCCGAVHALAEGASEATPKRASIAAQLFYLQYRQYKQLDPGPLGQPHPGWVEPAKPECTKELAPCAPLPHPPVRSQRAPTLSHKLSRRSKASVSKSTVRTILRLPCAASTSASNSTNRIGPYGPEPSAVPTHRQIACSLCSLRNF